MSVGAQLVTKADLRAALRKLPRSSGARVTQIIQSEDAISLFRDLNDVPDSYAGAGNFLPRIKSTEDQVEFAELKGTAGQIAVAHDAAAETVSIDDPNNPAAVLGGDGIFEEHGRHKMIVEPFDGLALGDINGQGSYFQCSSWVTNNAANCTTEVVTKSGADRMLRCYAPAGAGTARCTLTISSAIGLSNGIRIRFKIRTDQDISGTYGGIEIQNAAGSVVFRIGLTYVAGTGFRAVFYNGASTSVIIGDPTKDTWYQFDVVLSSDTASIAKIYTDSGYLTYKAAGSPTDLWNKISVFASNSSASDLNFDLDDPQVYSVPPLFTEL